MYNQLYAAWRRELNETPLGALPPDFYAKIADYQKRIKEESKLLDKKSVKISLLNHEAQNAKRMLEELLWTRYKKILQVVTKDEKVPSELLTVEEAKMCESLVTFASTYQRFSKDLLEGQSSQTATQPAETEASATAQKRLTLRFTKNIPSITGADMKSYGPFSVEDVASLPADNAKMLIKQGLAVLVEVS